MSAGRSDTSSKRKRSTPQKFKSRKLFATARHDILEQPEYSRSRDEVGEESLSKLPVTLQNKENLPEKCPNGPAPRARGRPKGSKNKTFPTLPTKVYSVREGRSAAYTTSIGSDVYSEPQSKTPHRGRGRPKGSTKVKPVSDGDDVPKRSRGRPKGSKNKKRPKAAQPKMLTSGEKIGRGRPQKISHANVEEGLTPKRGRGRPKGSPNKVTSVKRKMLTSGEKIGRGRPQKIPHANVEEGLTPKRGRGRPKGSPNKVTSLKRLALMSGSFEVKKRGRPKKIILHHSALISLTPKGPRGRPRKKERFSEVARHDHEVKSSESNTEDEDDIDREKEDNEDDDDDDDDDDDK